MPAEHLHEPWRSFLSDVDVQLSGPTEIHCLGALKLWVEIISEVSNR